MYLRVSTEDQHPENQMAELVDLAHRRGLDVAAVYTEKESAWQAGHQHEFARLLKDARRGRFQVLYVWALDRVTREGTLRLLQVIDTLHNFGVQLISLQESWTDCPPEYADILYAFAACMAKNESARRSARTKAGLERRRAQGIRLGRPAGSVDKKKRKKRSAAFRV